jgi:hypothetical protein
MLDLKRNQSHGGSITNKNTHNYRRPPGNRKHLQLTSNLIVGCVRQHLKKYSLSNSTTN